MEMSDLKVPIIAIIIGEGGSGGALALAVADKVWMLENTIYSILSPEGFATILWKDGSRSEEAAELMKITSGELLNMGIVDKVIPERGYFTSEIIEAIKYGVFNGIYQFSIDEGKCTMVMVPYDLLNAYFNSKGEENFLEKNQYELMILFTMMKFHGKLVYAIESDDLGKDGKSKLACDRKGVLNLFEKKDDADIHKYDIGYGRKESKGLNIIELRNSINEISEEVEVVKIEIKENVFEISSKKLAYILNEMTKINQ